MKRFRSNQSDPFFLASDMHSKSRVRALEAVGGVGVLVALGHRPYHIVGHEVPCIVSQKAIDEGACTKGVHRPMDLRGHFC